MHLKLNEEQQILLESFDRLFRTHSAPARVRAALPLGFDRQLWSELVSMGVPAMRLDKKVGGLGLPLFETVQLLVKFGIVVP